MLEVLPSLDLYKISKNIGIENSVIDKVSQQLSSVPLLVTLPRMVNFSTPSTGNLQ